MHCPHQRALTAIKFLQAKQSKHNCCTNFHELAKKAEKHELPMIAIKHAAQDMLSVFETNKINEIPGKFKEAVNLNEEYTQYGTNHWKRKPSGYATRPHGEKWYGRYNCPFRKWCGYADYREFSLIPDLFKKSDDLRNVDPLTLLFFGSVLNACSNTTYEANTSVALNSLKGVDINIEKISEIIKLHANPKESIKKSPAPKKIETTTANILRSFS